MSQLRSANGSLSWIARRCRPEKTYICGKSQHDLNIDKVKHLEVANKVLHDMKDTSNRGLLFKIGAFKFSEAIMITVSDASWANDQKVVYHAWDLKTFPRKSQHGRLTLFGHPDLWDGTEGYVHVIGFKGGLLKRTCRSTMRAETHGMLYATEASEL